MSEYFVTGDDVLKLVNAIRLIETSAYRGNNDILQKRTGIWTQRLEVGVAKIL